MMNAKRAAIAVGVIGLIYVALPGIAFVVQALSVWFFLVLGALNAIDRGVARQSGCETIPEVSQLEELFGKGDHTVSGGKIHFTPGGPNDACQWSTDVYFGRRYQLQMWADIVVDRRTSKVLRVTSGPRFLFFEIESIDFSSGAPGTTYVASRQRDLSAGDWKKVVDAGGDLSAIGIQLETGAPIANFDELVNWSRTRAK